MKEGEDKIGIFNFFKYIPLSFFFASSSDLRRSPMDAEVTTTETLIHQANGGDSITHLGNFCSSSLSSLMIIGRFLSTSTTNPNSFVVSYLVNSCGLSQEQAISASRSVRFKTPDKPDAVLTILRNSGFTKPHISKLVTKFPNVLTTSIEKTLRPKLSFLSSIGLDLVEFLCRDPLILRCSLVNTIIPYYGFLKSIVGTDSNVITILKRSVGTHQAPERRIVPNISILRDIGVSESDISMLLVNQPRALNHSTRQFVKMVEEIKGMGFDPLKRGFVLAILGYTSNSKTSWKTKVDVFRRWGLSEEETLSTFRKQPCFMRTSEKKIMCIMDFLVNQMGYDRTILLKNPTVISLSLEKRIIPRCLVIQVLVTKGLVPKDLSVGAVLLQVEKMFLDKYVTKYEKEVPELLEIYRRKFNHLETQKVLL